MRHDAWRRDPASYPLHGQIHPRFTDVDFWQHLNNAALISMHGESVQQALRAAVGDAAWRGGDPMLAPVASVTDFLAEAYYPAPLNWGARLAIGDDGRARVATALFQNDRCVGLHETTVAAWRDGGTVPITDAQRAMLARADAAAPASADSAQAAHAAAVAPQASAARGPSGTPDAAAAHDAPPALSRFPWRTRVALRFGDSDGRRVTSDFFLARCAEQMRVEFMNAAWSNRRAELGGMMVAHVGLRWLHRGAPGPHWDVGCAVAHLGERSVAVRGAMFDGDRCVATCDSVMVAIDPATRRSAPMPAAAASMLAPFRLGSAGA